MTSYGVIVHAGAGYHSKTKETHYMAVCRLACRAAVERLKKGDSALEATEAALKCLEDSPLTNAGLGSTLNIDGNVECDACVTCSESGYFGGVGSMSGIRYPSAVAASLLRQQLERPTLELGRIPPSILVGDGAYQWAVRHGHTPVPSGGLITKESHDSFCKYKRRLNQYLKSTEQFVRSRKRPLTISVNETAEAKKRTSDNELFTRLDTVGVVCVDMQGHLVSGASSGGIALKCPGRIGQACIPGAGCWAAEHENPHEVVGSATSGTGEHLMRTLFAKRACEACFHETDTPTESLEQCIRTDFLSARSLSSVNEKNAGVILLRTYGPTNGCFPMLEFIYAHTTSSMSVGYMSSKCKRPTVLISRADDDSFNSVTIGGRVIKL